MPGRPIKQGSNLDFLNAQTNINLPEPVNPGDAANKFWVEQLVNDLRGETNGFFRLEDLDCSTNPHYPPTPYGKGYIVTAEGKIGGNQGIAVGKGDTIRYRGQIDESDRLVVDENGNPVASPGGTQGEVGSQFYIVEGNREQATPNTAGIVRLATAQQSVEGSVADVAVTPESLKVVLDNLVNNNLEYTANIGNGTDNVFTITHPLNTTAVDIVVRENSTGEIWQVYCAAPTANTIVVEFANAINPNQFQVIIKR